MIRKKNLFGNLIGLSWLLKGIKILEIDNNIFSKMERLDEKISNTNSEDHANSNAKIAKYENFSVDFCVMLDCTGSMGSYINMSRNKIKDIIKQVKELYKESDIRISIVGYRDVQDRKRFEIFQFNNKIDEAKIFLDKLVADGGGDTPEDVNGAFQKALYELSWESPVRLIVHVADAPCHGQEFHSCGDDNYPKGFDKDLSWNQIFKDLVEKRIDYTFLKISDITDKMFNLFQKMAIENGADKFDISFNQDFAQGDSSKSDGKIKGGEEGFASVISEKIKGAVEKELKKGLKKRLEKRTEENSELVSKIRSEISEMVSKLDLVFLKEKYSDLSSKLGECILSTNNFIEALADEDCICITFDIGRSQAAIVDPTQIIIKNVFPSFLTAGSFFHSTEYALKKNKLAHGGYEKHAEGMILKGAASENITGIMPLYICEENWPIAKRLMKLALGWDVTLEPAGYTHSQIKTVPFLILAKLAQMKHEKPGSEFLNFQFGLVKQTCMKIMEEDSKPEFTNKFSEEIKILYENYIDIPTTRTIDSVPSNPNFLAQVYISSELGYITRNDEYNSKLFIAVIEEELRRRQNPIPEDINFRKLLIDLLNINHEEYIEKPFKKFVEENSDHGSLANSIIFEGKKEAISLNSESKQDAKDLLEKEKNHNEQRSISCSYDVHLKHGEIFNHEQSKAMQEYKLTLKKVIKYLYPLRELLISEKLNEVEEFKTWKIIDEFQFFALYIQNKLQHKNSHRREAFSNNSYKNPWKLGREYIINFYIQLVEEEKSAKINEYLSKIKNSLSKEDAMKFALTGNLNEAAGILMNVLIGSTFMDYFKALVDFNPPEFEEKIEMLTSGYYQKVKLIQDCTGWIPSKKNTNLMLRAHFNRLSQDKWIKFFPKASRTYMTILERAKILNHE